jgi:hypothetical protein
MTSMRRIISIGLLGAALALAACGEDPEPAADKGAGKGGGGEGGGGGRVSKKKGGKAVPLDAYHQIDESFRRTFTEVDFRPDPTGDENRDPFRSYVVRQGVLGREGKSNPTIQPTDVCTAKNSKASGYSLRDLRLIGIVLRGKIRGFAQFRDGSGLGWTVKRGDCLGKEKAIVQSIDSGSVSLEVVPEAPPNTAPPDPEKRIIPLYPQELAPTVDLPEPEAGP